VSDMDINKLKLGSRYRDKVTGFVGSCTGRTDFLNGCVQALLEARSNDGAITAHWVDYDRLELIEEEEALSMRRTGGPGVTVNVPTGR
jgi:hypothetical protein